jgi:GxxExxY protein
MPRRLLIHHELTQSIIAAFYEVYNTLGFGFLEHVYMAALERELRARGHQVAREVWVTVFYKGEPLRKQRLDMVVDETVTVEGKSTVELRAHDLRQLQNYLFATDFQVGLLLHFGPEPKVHRLVSTRPVRNTAAPGVPAESHVPSVLDAERPGMNRAHRGDASS